MLSMHVFYENIVDVHVPITYATLLGSWLYPIFTVLKLSFLNSNLFL